MTPSAAFRVESKEREASAMVTNEQIAQVAQRLGVATNAERVILFGSYARGDAREQSDVDLLIVAENDQPRFKRTRGLHSLFRPYPFAMDLLVYTPKEIEKWKGTPVSFVSTALREGKVVYERGH